MPLDRDERDKIREEFAGPQAAQVEQAASEFLTATELGQTTLADGAAGRLDGFGYKSDAQRAAARKDAAQRRKDAAEGDGKDGETKQPAKQPAPAKQAPGKATRGGEQG